MSGELLSLSFSLQSLSRYFFWWGWGEGGEREATDGKIRVNGKEDGLKEEKRKKKKISVEEVLSRDDKPIEEGKNSCSESNRFQ